MTTRPPEVRFEPVVMPLPECESAEAQALGVLALDGSPELASLPSADRSVLLSSLATTTRRVTYHLGHFHTLTVAALERFERHGGDGVGIVLDTVAKCISFEAGAALAAMRSAIDEVVYIAALRARVSESSAHSDWQPMSLVTTTHPSYADPKYDVPELRLLRGPYRTWLDDLNAYRNAVVHRGNRSPLAYHPPASEHPWAGEPESNVMLVPDRDSIGGGKRPHRWTFTQGRRLEELMMSCGRTYQAFATELVKAWGGLIPAPGTMKQTAGMLVVFDPSGADPTT